MITLRTNFRHNLPYLVLLVWISWIGISVWQSAKLSEQPPFYDAMGYYQKAKVFYESLAGGNFPNPLNLPPTSRPPGTILVSYPFGFTPAPNGFFFRTVFFSFLIWCASVFIALTSLKRMLYDPLFTTACILIFGSLPFFFQYDCDNELPHTMYWGLVDGFLAAVAALAIASALRAILRRSWAWSIASAIIAAFCTLIKPSGFYVLALTFAFYCTGAVLLFVYAWKSSKGCRSDFALFFGGIASYVILGATAFYACTHSRYLSTEMFSFGRRSLEVLRSDFDMSFTFGSIFEAIKSSLGQAGFPISLFLCVAVIVGIFWVSRGRSLKGVLFGAFVLGWIVLIFLFGLYFWLVMTGFSQIRYFYPFLLMSLVLVAFVAAQALIRFRRSRWLLIAICLLAAVPSINLASVLAFGSSSDKWQRWSGVNISITEPASLAIFTRKLLDEARFDSGKKVIRIYNVTVGGITAALYSTAIQNSILYPDDPKIVNILPLDWQNPSVYRLSELISSDYIISRKISLQHESLNHMPAATFAEETVAIEAFCASLSENQGVQKVFEDSRCRVLRVVDPDKLEGAFHTFIQNIQWRQIFEDANAEFFMDSGDESESAINSRIGDVFLVQKVRATFFGETLIVRIIGRQLRKDESDLPAFLFCHLIDSEGNILHNSAAPIQGRMRARTVYEIDLKGPISPETAALAIGIYLGNQAEEVLEVSAGDRDWGNRRMLIPIFDALSKPAPGRNEHSERSTQ